jgi:hypothetical protein
LKLLTISAQFWGVLIILYFLFTKKIIRRDNYIGNNINYFLTNLPYRANGYEMIFIHTLTHLLNEIKFLLLSISNKLTKKNLLIPILSNTIWIGWMSKRVSLTPLLRAVWIAWQMPRKKKYCDFANLLAYLVNYIKSSLNKLWRIAHDKFVV